nr:hypothetical protein [uncultured Acetobacteroides sp.]
MAYPAASRTHPSAADGKPWAGALHASAGWAYPSASASIHDAAGYTLSLSKVHHPLASFMLLVDFGGCPAAPSRFVVAPAHLGLDAPAFADADWQFEVELMLLVAALGLCVMDVFIFVAALYSIAVDVFIFVAALGLFGVDIYMFVAALYSIVVDIFMYMAALWVFEVDVFMFVAALWVIEVDVFMFVTAFYLFAVDVLSCSLVLLQFDDVVLQHVDEFWLSEVGFLHLVAAFALFVTALYNSQL